MARHNLLAAGLPAPLLRADALTRTSRGLLGYADPARRDGSGRRITSVSTLPSVADLDAVHAARPPVLRLPPGIDYDAWTVRARWRSSRWTAGLGRRCSGRPNWPGWPAGRRCWSASRGRAASASAGRSPVTTRTMPASVRWGSSCIDPDAAVVRAHLVRHYAARHGLWLLDPHLAYLTGSVVPPGVRGFRVLDAAPYREKTVAGWARRDGIGTLEIKQRGTPIIPDDLRRRLRPALTRSDDGGGHPGRRPDRAGCAGILVPRGGSERCAVRPRSDGAADAAADHRRGSGRDRCRPRCLACASAGCSIAAVSRSYSSTGFRPSHLAFFQAPRKVAMADSANGRR